MVLCENFGEGKPADTKCFAYTSLKDANNKIVDLWSNWHREQYSPEYKLTNRAQADGRMKWLVEKNKDTNSEGVNAWIEKTELMGETSDEAKTWPDSFTDSEGSEPESPNAAEESEEESGEESD